jgi:hypothetical protein
LLAALEEDLIWVVVVALVASELICLELLVVVELRQGLLYYWMLRLLM